MIARMATYRASGNPNDLARRAEEGILPLFKEQHGFRSYSVAIDGNDVLSLSVWDTRADAEAGSELAADFVRTNMAGEPRADREALRRGGVQHDARREHDGGRDRLTTSRCPGLQTGGVRV